MTTQHKENGHGGDNIGQTLLCEALMQMNQQSQDGVLMTDDQSVIIALNANVCEIFGYDESAIIGQTIDQFILLDGMPAEDASIQDVTDIPYLSTMVTGQNRLGFLFPLEVATTSFERDDEWYYLYLMRDLSERLPVARLEDDLIATLSPRQKQVLQLVARGLTSRQIAEQLTISVKTVETHRANIMQKLSVSNVTGLVRIAVQHGIA